MSEPQPPAEDPVAMDPAGAADPGAAGDSPEAAAAPPVEGTDATLLALVDRLAALLDRSELSELEVESGGTGLVLRKPVAVAAPVPMVTAVPPAGRGAGDGGPVPVGPGVDAPEGRAAAPARPSVKAPLTGIFYTSPSPGATPYVSVGDHVSVGQVIGLIEAMKLFNEIKSDLAGRVVRIVAESGSLVKAKQPLIEVDPS
ncbi:MAG TPA: acetyl-CoA carboxylase [Candidatus Limnocylindrales bacterium]|nr:acetyl-CoA carboxylase [Candidatus Limnocylindrales bacterium]